MPGTTSTNNLERITPLIGRLLLAAVFIYSGLTKIAAPAYVQDYIASAGLPVPVAAYVVAIAIEVGGGLLFLVGYQTRAISLVFAVYTLVTALAFHTAFGDQMQLLNFLKNLAIAGGLLHVAMLGGGTYSVDTFLGRARGTLRSASVRSRTTEGGQA